MPRPETMAPLINPVAKKAEESPMHSSLFTCRSLLAAAALVAVAACDPSQNAGPTSAMPGAGNVVASQPGNGKPDPEEFEICKYGSSATFDFSVEDLNTNTTTTGQVTLADGECTVIALVGGLGADVTVTEQVPTGFTLDRVDITTITQGVISGPTSVSGPTVTGHIQGSKGGALQGVLAEFFNSRTGGGEGCTPGYWKQPQHFDSWPSPYTPSTQFSAVFENAFPGMTLLQVLAQGGGGLNALGRHTVAALLNAGSGGVNYNLSTSDVINAFNAVFPGTKTQYNQQKDIFEGFNEQGCPLN